MMFESKEDIKYQKVQQNKLNTTLNKIEFNRNYKENQLARQQNQVKNDLRAMNARTTRSNSLTRKEQRLGLGKLHPKGTHEKPSGKFVTSRNIIVKGKSQKRVPLLQEEQIRLAEANQASREILREKFRRDHQEALKNKKTAPTQGPSQAGNTAVPSKSLKLPHIESATPKPNLSKQLSRNEEQFTFTQHRLKKQSSILSTPLHPDPESPEKGDSQIRDRKGSQGSDSSEIFASVSQSQSGSKRSSLKDLPRLDDVLVEKRMQLEQERQTWKDVKQCRYLRGYDPPNMIIPEDSHSFVFGKQNTFHKQPATISNSPATVRTD